MPMMGVTLKWGETDHQNEVFKSNETNTLLLAGWMRIEGVISLGDSGTAHLMRVKP